MRLAITLSACAALATACGSVDDGDAAGNRNAGSMPQVSTDCDPDLGDSDTPSTPTDDDAPPVDPPASGAAVVPVVSDGYSSGDATYKRLVGPGLFVIDTLWELNLGRGSAAMASQRFRAPSSGNLASVQQYFWGSPGYSGGVGGTVRLRVYPDDGSQVHAPNMAGAPIATGAFYPAMSGGSFTDSSQAFTTVSLSASAPLVAGQLYHVVYSNDLDSANDFISLDCSASNLPKHGRANRWLDPTDWAVLRRSSATGNAWQDLTTSDHYGGRAYFNPILKVTMADGSSFGSSPVETGSPASYVVQASAAAPIRERVTFAQTRTVSAFSVHTAAEVAGTLHWEVKRGSDVVAHGDIVQAPANYRTDTTIDASREQGNVVWYDIALESPVTMTAGETYDLVFTPEGSSRWRFINQRNGKAYGFDWSGGLLHSTAQHSRDGQWRNTYYWNLDSQGQDGDSSWPVVFHTEP